MAYNNAPPAPKLGFNPGEGVRRWGAHGGKRNKRTKHTKRTKRSKRKTRRSKH
jgi:hypothetical protein